MAKLLRMNVPGYKAGSWFLVVAVAIYLSLFVALAQAYALSDSSVGVAGVATIGESFEGEVLDYKVSFWVLDSVARARITFEKEGKELAEEGEEGDRAVVFVATMNAHTTGVVRFVRNRADRITARMEEVDGGRRLRTLSFEKRYVIGKKKRRKLIVMDYEKGVMRWTKWRGGAFSKSGELPIPEGVTYDDPLTAFYNLRYGAYGAARSGAAFTVATFPTSDGRDVDIDVRFASPEELGKQREDAKVGAAHLAHVRVDKELFDSSSGDIDIFFDSEMVVTYGVAKDVLFFGDVRGALLPQMDIQPEYRFNLPE